MQCCLIVDDSDIIRKVAGQFAERAGYMIIEAGDGAQALTACRARVPDVILLDWQLPGMSPLEFLRELRTVSTGAWPQILYMMTELDIADLTAVHSAGITDFILKPFYRETLMAKLAEFARAGHIA